MHVGLGHENGAAVDATDDYCAQYDVELHARELLFWGKYFSGECECTGVWRGIVLGVALLLSRPGECRLVDS